MGWFLWDFWPKWGSYSKAKVGRFWSWNSAHSALQSWKAMFICKTSQESKAWWAVKLMHFYSLIPLKPLLLSTHTANRGSFLALNGEKVKEKVSTPTLFKRGLYTNPILPNGPFDSDAAPISYPLSGPTNRSPPIGPLILFSFPPKQSHYPFLINQWVTTIKLGSWTLGWGGLGVSCLKVGWNIKEIWEWRVIFIERCHLRAIGLYPKAILFELYTQSLCSFSLSHTYDYIWVLNKITKNKI